METIFALLIIACLIFSPIYAQSEKKEGEGKGEFIGATIASFISFIIFIYLFALMLGVAEEFHDWFWGGIRFFFAEVDVWLMYLEKGVHEGIRLLFYLLGFSFVAGGVGAAIHFGKKRVGKVSPASKDRDMEDQGWESVRGKSLSELLKEKEKFGNE